MNKIELVMYQTTEDNLVAQIDGKLTVCASNCTATAFQPIKYVAAFLSTLCVHDAFFTLS